MHREREREQIEAFLRQPVFVASRSFLVDMAFDDACRQQPPQPVGEDVRGDAERCVDVVIALQPEEQRRKQHCGPSVGDRVDRMEHGGIDAFVIAPRACGLTAARGPRRTRGMVRAWPRVEADVAQMQDLVAVSAGEQRVEFVAAAAVDHARRQVEPCAPAVLPLPHAERDRIETETLLGEPIIQFARRRAVGQPLQHAVRDQIGEPCRQGAACSAGATTQVLEASDPQESIAQDQERPTVADHLEHPGALAAAQHLADALDIPWRIFSQHLQKQSSKRRGIDR